MRSSAPFKPARLSAIAAASTLFLAACAGNPAYEAPTITPAPFHNAALLEQRDTVVAAPQLDQWWLGFRDPVLTTIVQRAISQNLDLAASLARVEQAQAAAQRASAQRLPEGDINGQAARQRQSLQSPLGKIASGLPGYERTQTLYDVGVGASWELDLAGAARRGAEAANAGRAAAEASHLGVRISIAAEAADAYFRIRAAQARLVLAEEQIKSSTGLLDMVHLRSQKGLSGQRENAQAEARLSQVRAGLPPLRIALERQLNRLDVLLGAAPGAYSRELSARGDTGAVTVPAVSAAEGSAGLLRRRPDILAAERQLAAAHARISVATASYYPSLSLSALLGFESLGTDGVSTGNSFQPQALLGLRWRLFDFGRIDAEVAQAKGARQEALVRYRQTVLRATEEVENALMTLVQLEKQSAELNDEIAARERARHAAQETFQGGTVSLDAVLEEDRMLLQARDQLAQVRADDARAAVSVFRALGGDWEK